MGDFNARTKTLPDYFTLDDSVNLNKTRCLTLFQTPAHIFHIMNEKGISLDRRSSDIKVNNSGHQLLEMCKLNNMYIVNGRIGKDKSQDETACKEISVIGYTVTSLELLGQLVDFVVDASTQCCLMYISLYLQ